MVANGDTTGRSCLGLIDAICQNISENKLVNNRYNLGWKLFNNMIGTKWLTPVLILSLALVSPGFGSSTDKAPAKLQVNRGTLVNFVKSLIIPGWGQLSSGNNIRAITFLTAEVAGFYGYRVNYADGEDLEATFKLFADEYWDYRVWVTSNYVDDNGQRRACGGNLRTHQMPTIGDIDGDGIEDPLKDHHFYENIGKYPEFSCGWDDYIDGGIGYDYDEDEDKHKAEYIDMRTRSNELYRNAQVAGTLIMVNHLVSAFDAAFGTDITRIESSNYTGKLYINPLNAVNSIALEVKF